MSTEEPQEEAPATEESTAGDVPDTQPEAAPEPTPEPVPEEPEPVPAPTPEPEAPKLPDPVQVTFDYIPDGNNAMLAAKDDKINFMDTASITISSNDRKFTYRRNRID